MTVRAEPAAVPAELVALTRRLGEPAADLVVLAEGNTSTVVGGGRFAVKASGSRMDRAEPADFVLAEVAPLLEAMDSPRADQATLSGLLAAAGGGRNAPSRSASIETLVHVAAIEAGAAWVAHTHPTAVVGLLAVAQAEQLWSAPLFPDEAVVLGPPAWVPYQEPGLELGRGVRAAVRRYRDEAGVPPRLVLLGNHGIVALGATAAEVEAITVMCVKAARVRSVALAAGRSVPLDVTEARRLAGRADEVARRRLLEGQRR